MSRTFVSRVSNVSRTRSTSLAAKASIASSATWSVIAARAVAASAVAAAVVGCGGHAATPKPAPPDPIEEPTPASGPAADAKRVGTSLRPDLRACYEAALKKDPKVEGAVKFSAKVDPQGDVTSVAAVGATTLAPDLVDCLSKRIEQAHFAAPGPAGATVEIPMTFKKGAL